MKYKYMALALVGSLLLVTGIVSAQLLTKDIFVRINQIISAGYPKMTAHVSVTDENGKPVEVRPDQFVAYVDDVRVKGSISVGKRDEQRPSAVQPAVCDQETPRCLEPQ